MILRYGPPVGNQQSTWLRSDRDSAANGQAKLPGRKVEAMRPAPKVIRMFSGTPPLEQIQQNHGDQSKQHSDSDVRRNHGLPPSPRLLPGQ
jgi:hypothetical protein